MSTKKQINLLFFIAVFHLFIPVNIEAQSQQLKFSLILGTNGVSLGKVNAITQDCYGFMWFSDQTNRCITRFDGSHMKRFQNDPKNPNSLGGYYPECLATDSIGTIWVGFYGQGLDRFDPLTNTFTHYRHDAKDPGSLANDFVTAVVIDHLGNLWVGTYGGLDLLDKKTGKFNHYSFDANDSTSLSCNTIRAIYEDHEGTLWVGTGFPFDNKNEGGLNRFNRNTGTFTRYLHDPKNAHSLINDEVRAIFEDSKGTFWVGTKGDGLHSLDRRTGLFTRHTYDKARPDKLSRPALGSDIADHITFITEDAKQNLWIGTYSNGIIRYDPVTKKLTHFGNNEESSGTYKENSSWCCYPSKDGLVWVSTQEANLYRVDLYNITISNYTDRGKVNAFFEETPSVTWLGTHSGLIRLDTQNKTSRKFTHDPLNKNSLSSNVVELILKDKQGTFWIGTPDGLNSYDPITGKFTRYMHNPYDSTSLSNNAISEIYEDRDLNLWIGTWTAGLNRLDRGTGKFTHYRSNPPDPRSLSTDQVSAIIEDEKKDLWIGNDNNGGLNKLNRKTGKFDRYIPGLSALSLYIDADKIMWVGTQNGLYKYNRKSDDFTGVTINASAGSIIGDNENNLWISSSEGIIKLNQNREHFIRYGKENGINTENNDFGRIYKQKDGKLIFTNTDGYYAFYPNKLKTPSDYSKVFFTNLLLNGKPVITGTNSPFQEPIFKAREIKLNYDQNVFSITFTAIDYRTSGDNKISYKLEHYDNEWRQASAEEPVNYFKVPPGNYIFRVKAVNSGSGLWSEKSIDIIISPPWWQTWWAYTIYILLFISLVFSIHRYQKAKLIKAERERARVKELEQAKQIEKAYHQLKTTQAQLIQSEKMASLGELTAGIAHEIQNPLNFVNNFSQVNKELLEELQAEHLKPQAQRDGKTEDGIIKDVIENEEKINHHGKRADAIVKGMLQHSRKSTSQKEPTDINKLADEYLRLSYHGVRAKDQYFNATMQTDFDQSIEKINIIPQDIGRVILNLLTNAFYAVMEKKKEQKDSYEPTVSVITKRIGDKVIIKIADNGNGIPQKILDKIFQPFFTTKPTGQGTGLGLSLSYDIIKAHGGELKVETKEGEWAMFIVKMPNV